MYLRLDHPLMDHVRLYVHGANFKNDTKKEMVKNNGRLKLNNDESKPSIIELFPWILEFKKMCRCIHTEKSMASLTELMQFYVR